MRRSRGAQLSSHNFAAREGKGRQERVTMIGFGERGTVDLSIDYYDRLLLILTYLQSTEGQVTLHRTVDMFLTLSWLAGKPGYRSRGARRQTGEQYYTDATVTWWDRSNVLWTRESI